MTMKTMIEELTIRMSEAFDKAGYDGKYGKVTVSNRPDLCEFQCNGAMAAAKEYKKAPIMIANDVAAKLGDEQVFTDVSAGNRAGVRTFMVEKLHKKEIWYVLLKRPFEKLVRLIGKF